MNSYRHNVESYEMQLISAISGISKEARRQVQKWGEQNHPDGIGKPLDNATEVFAKWYCDEAARDGNVTWRDILHEEVAEAFNAKDDDALELELQQVAAVATSWLMAVRRRRRG